jgi:hypothetical protein
MTDDGHGAMIQLTYRVLYVAISSALDEQFDYEIVAVVRRAHESSVACFVAGVLQIIRIIEDVTE